MSRQVDEPRQNPDILRNWVRALRPMVKGWHRSEVRGLDRIPEGPSLLLGVPLL